MLQGATITIHLYHIACKEGETAGVCVSSTY
jgi:hypothetical protein